MKTKRIIAWAVFNVGQLWLAHSWLFNGNETSGNCLKFLMGFSMISAVACFSKTFQAQCRKKGRSVPAWLSQLLDASLAMMLASQGHFVLASMAMAVAVAECIAFDSDSVSETA